MSGIGRFFSAVCHHKLLMGVGTGVSAVLGGGAAIGGSVLNSFLHACPKLDNPELLKILYNRSCWLASAASSAVVEASNAVIEATTAGGSVSIDNCGPYNFSCHNLESVTQVIADLDNFVNQYIYTSNINDYHGTAIKYAAYTLGAVLFFTGVAVTSAIAMKKETRERQDDELAIQMLPR